MDEPRRVIINSILVIVIILSIFTIVLSKISGEEIYRETYTKQISFIQSQAMYADFNIFYNFRNPNLDYGESEISFFDMQINYDFFEESSMTKLYASGTETEVFFPYRAAINPNLVYYLPEEKISTRGEFYITKQGEQFKINQEPDFDLINCPNDYKIENINYIVGNKGDTIKITSQDTKEYTTKFEQKDLDENIILIYHPSNNLVLNQAMCLLSNNIISNTDYKIVYLPTNIEQIIIYLKDTKKQEEIIKYLSY